MRKLLFLTLLAAVLSACDEKEKEPSPVTLLSVGTENIYGDAGTSGFFAMVHDSEGKLLGVEELLANSNRAIVGLPASRPLTVTFLRHQTTNNGGDFFNLQSFEVEAGAQFFMRDNVPVNFPQPTFAGYANVEIHNFPSSRMIDNTMAISTSLGINGGITNRQYEAGKYKFTAMLATDSDTLLVTTYRDGQPVYGLKTGVSSDETVIMDYNDFVLAEDIVAPQATGNTWGYTLGFNDGQPSPKYSVSTFQFEAMGGSQSPAPALGYVPGYDYYSTYVSNYQGSSGIVYHKVGEPKILTAFPSFSYSITDRSPNTFNATTNISFDYQNTTWYYENTGSLYVYWNTIKPTGGSLAMQDFPDVVKNKYPQLDFSRLKLYSVSWVDRETPYNYGTLLDDVTNGTSLKFFESMTYYGN